MPTFRAEDEATARSFGLSLGVGGWNIVSNLSGLNMFLFTSPNRPAKGSLPAWPTFGLTSTVPTAPTDANEVAGEI